MLVKYIVPISRDTGSPVCRRVEDVLDEELAVCDAIRMEVLAGAHDDIHLGRLRRLLARVKSVQTRSADFEEAANLYLHCRRNGVTVGKLIDCLIAAVALRVDASLLHNDRDFDLLASIHTDLRIAEM